MAKQRTSAITQMTSSATGPAGGDTTASKAAVRQAKVLIVDDHPMVRERLAELINAEADLAVCGEAEDAHGARSLIDAVEPEVAIVDISLKDSYGIELINDLKAYHPRVPVLVLSMHDETLYAERALRAGASGYLNKQEASRKVISAIRTVLAGQVYVSEKMAAGILRKVAGLGRGRESSSPVDMLSDRELEVFQLLGDGKPVREIAALLHVSVKTVEAHREHIKQKLKLKSSAELLRLAIEHALRGE